MNTKESNLRPKNLLLILYSLPLLLSSCASVTLPDTELCASNGQLQNGMMCSTTISRKKREIDLDKTIEFLEASEFHGPALCQSSADWIRLKNALETACILLGKRCKKNMVEEIGLLDKTLKELINLIPTHELSQSQVQ